MTKRGRGWGRQLGAAGVGRAVTGGLALLLSVLGTAGAVPALAAGTSPSTSPSSSPSTSPTAGPSSPSRERSGPGRCPPSGRALAFSDALDKVSVGGVSVGGLSSLAYDRRTRSWASTVDNRAVAGRPPEPSRIWFFRDLRDPHVVGGPLVLRRPDGTPYDGLTADDEGLAVLPDGRFVVSSETEPSIRVFGRDGVQQASLPVPARFAVVGRGAGEATANATLEGLTLTPDGRTLVAAMEGALTGDVSASGDATLHRFLVYERSRRGDRWRLVRQVAYRTEVGQRIPEVAAVDGSRLVVQEESYDPDTGNAVRLYAVDLRRSVDVSRVADLSTASPRVVLAKTLLADLARCPTLGATSKQPQTNPLLDNFEGMAVTGVGRGGHGRTTVSLSLISDDNFNPTQVTRVLDLRVQLPRRIG